MAWKRWFELFVVIIILAILALIWPYIVDHFQKENVYGFLFISIFGYGVIFILAAYFALKIIRSAR